MHLHTIVACSITGILAFGAGTFYGHSLGLLITKQAKAELSLATLELKKLRGEIVQFTQQHLPKF